MIWQPWFGSGLLAAAAMIGMASQVSAQFAVEVVAYDPGSTPVPGFIDSTSALGEPEHFTGEGSFPGVVSPFNPPFLTSEVVSIGEGGALTLRLSHFAKPQAAGPELGVFTNVGLLDASFPNGQAGSPPSAFGVDQALVEVSEKGVDWERLGTILFDTPTNGYTDLVDPFSGSPGNSPTDFQQPFNGSLSSFDGLPYSSAGNPDMLDLLVGSGGGTWLDISSTSLSQVGYIRFSVEDDGTGMDVNFELDAVSIATGAVGAMTVPEPPTFAVLALTGILLTISRQARNKFARC